MPEMTMTALWPDGTVHEHYSPSLVLHDHLATGTSYTVTDFVARSLAALAEASQRVKAKYGFECTSAMASAERISVLAAGCDPDASVAVLAMQPPLPSPQESR